MTVLDARSKFLHRNQVVRADHAKAIGHRAGLSEDAINQLVAAFVLITAPADEQDRILEEREKDIANALKENSYSHNGRRYIELNESSGLWHVASAAIRAARECMEPFVLVVPVRWSKEINLGDCEISIDPSDNHITGQEICDMFHAHETRACLDWVQSMRGRTHLIEQGDDPDQTAEILHNMI
jgi:hypothetical protein